MKNLNTKRLALAAAAAAGLSAPALADFNYTDFSSTSGLTLVGSAVKNGNVIELTPADRAMSGATWVNEKQNVAGAWEATMTIRVPTVNGGGADGFALVIQNASNTALGGNGGGLGYAANPVFGQAGIANSFAIEVDMWDNSVHWSDMSSSHISLQSRGLLENSPEHQYSYGQVNCPDMSDGAFHTIRISYTPGTMKVFTESSSTPIITAEVNLASMLSLSSAADSEGVGQLAWIGVTASTGSRPDSQVHQLTSLSFSTIQIPAPGASALAGIGGLLLTRRKRTK